eukprot:1726868-Amphidinium_carterae.1
MSCCPFANSRLGQFGLQTGSVTLRVCLKDEDFMMCSASMSSQKATSLGSIQPDGRAQVLRHWYQSPDMGGKGVRMAPRKPPSVRGASPAVDVVRVLQDTRKTASLSRGNEDASKLDWGTLSEKARQAIRLWVA